MNRHRSKSSAYLTWSGSSRSAVRTRIAAPIESTDELETRGTKIPILSTAERSHRVWTSGTCRTCSWSICGESSRSCTCWITTNMAKTAVYKRIIDACIKTSAHKAAERSQDRAIYFLSALKSGLLDQLLTGATNCLLENMPQANDSNIDCDNQPSDIFCPDDKDYVCAPMFVALNEAMIQVQDESEIHVTKDVLDFIKSRTSQAGGDGVRPRCGQPCPLCKCPCTHELGHVTTDGDEKCHDTYHQPNGLAGVSSIQSNELTPGSCYANTVSEMSFRLSEDQEWHPYSEFDKVFQNWSQPVKKDPLRLREYIFYNFQDELVACTKSTKKCTQIPLEYNHNLWDIKEDIARKLK